MNEQILIENAKKGDKSALEELYKCSFNSLYKFVRYKVDTVEQAEDITAEAFVRAFENLVKFKGNSSFKTYVYTIAKNLVYKQYSEKQLVAFTNNEDIHSDLEYSKDLETEDQSDGEEKNNQDTIEVFQILKQLKNQEREILELRFLSNFSVKETAQTLKLSESNVKVTMHRALQKLKSLI